jgi:hypothetical protein
VAGNQVADTPAVVAAGNHAGVDNLAVVEVDHKQEVEASGSALAFLREDAVVDNLQET